MRTYRHLTYKELVQIETYLHEGKTYSDIAIELGRDVSTISRVVKAYSSSLGSFCADEAWVEIGKKRSLANNHPRILDDSVLAEFIVEKIESYWSPEQIAGKWRAENNEVLCHETIYQYIYRNKPQLIKLYLRRKGKKYRKERDKGKGGIPEMVMIDDRPKAVDGRESFGHWEGDTVIGKNYKQAIVTNVERK
ncbi:hypothetical protein COY06_02920, partial [Candidatus Peregrinibacteria bacterium CG_4_10_14_0_2_um_filter_41_8]